MNTLRVASPPARAVLIFDGDCGFCRHWVDRWRRRTGDRAEYRPFQDPVVAQRFPEIPIERSRRAVQLLYPDGRVVSGARAVFGLLAIGGSSLPLRIHQLVPGAAAIAERMYQFVADHQPLFARLSVLALGRAPSTYVASTRMFLRLLALVYLCAFASLAVQIRGLIGHDGILPAREYMSAIAAWQDADGVGISRYWQWPTIFWLNTSDRFLEGISLAGAALAGLVVVGVAPSLLLPLLWGAYLSLSVVCREFFSFQWEALLLEAGLLAIPLAPLAWRLRASDAFEPPRIARWLLWWLLFRFTLGSGIVKLASGDPTWANLDALTVHYETQPLPTPLAWYVSRLPAGFHKGTTAAVLAIELMAPWLFFGPRRARHLASAILIVLQVAIALTGNYTFFNLLTIALCVMLMDDAAFERIGAETRFITRGGRLQPALMRPKADPTSGDDTGSRQQRRPPRYPLVVASVLAVVTVPVSLVALTSQLGVAIPGSAVVRPLMALVEPIRSVNRYGLFAVMTTTRPEIIVEGSNDGVTWLPYEFKYKPGDPRRPLRWVAPHQPRVDWQMWFAALSRYEEEPWFQNFCLRLLEGSPAVMRLIAHDPFEGKPPRFVRGVLYRYRFADADTRRTSGVWWTREPLGLYSPPLSRASR